MSGQPGTMNAYYQRDIYRLLAKRGPMRVVHINNTLGLPVRRGSHGPVHAAANSIYKMRKAGLVERVTGGWRVVSGTRAPKERRGHSPGSKLVLRAHARHNIAKLHARKGRHPKPIATTALEQAWGWLPSTAPSLTPANESGPIVGGTVRPQETEAA